MLTQFPLIDDKTKSMLVYEVNHYPQYMLSGHHRVVWHRSITMNPAKIQDLCNEQRTRMCLPPPYATLSGQRSQDFLLKWAFNNIPTAHEWEKMRRDSTLVAEYRISSLAGDNGRVVLLRPINCKFVDLYFK